MLGDGWKTRKAFKVFERSIDYEVVSPPFPQCPQEIILPDPIRRSCPVITIPANLCPIGSNGEAANSYKLLVQVTVPMKCLQSRVNGSPNQDQTGKSPKPKRRRTAIKNRENFAYNSKGNKKMSNNRSVNGVGQDDKDGKYLIYVGHITLYEKGTSENKIKEMDYDMILKGASRSGEKISQEGDISLDSFNEVRMTKWLYC